MLSVYNRPRITTATKAPRRAHRHGALRYELICHVHTAAGLSRHINRRRHARKVIKFLVPRYLSEFFYWQKPTSIRLVRLLLCVERPDKSSAIQRLF